MNRNCCKPSNFLLISEKAFFFFSYIKLTLKVTVIIQRNFFYKNNLNFDNQEMWL